MSAFFVVATIVLLLTSCIATRYLVGLPLRWPGANFSEWSEELFWLIMWPIPLFLHIRDHHKSPPPTEETAESADLESEETAEPADEDAEDAEDAAVSADSDSADDDSADDAGPDGDKA